MPNVAVLQNCVNVVTISTSYEDFVTYAAQIDAETSNIQFKLPDVNSLPDLSTNVLPDGTAVFVESIDTLAVSSMKSWISFDGAIIRNDGNSAVLASWGANCYGQLGLNCVTTLQISPLAVYDNKNIWCNISAGRNNSFGIKTDGTLWTWGANNSGVLANNSSYFRSSPGTVSGGGSTWCKAASSLGSSFQGYHGAAVKTDGTLWTWGSNNYGQIGDNTVISKFSPVTVSGGGTTWQSISAGINTVGAIKSDNTLWLWGRNNVGELGNNSTVGASSPVTVAGGGTTWSSVAVGSFSTAAIKTDGTLWTWGYNAFGQLGNSLTTSRCSPGTTSGCGTTWCNISAGLYSVAAIKTDGTLWAWGQNSCGKLGDGTTANKSSPVTVAGGGTTWCSVSVGLQHSSALQTDATLWTWGSNNNGQLGINVADRSSPGTISGKPKTWCSTSAGRVHTLGIYFCDN